MKEPLNLTTLDGEEYIIGMFDGLKGRRILLRLLELMKPSQEMDAKNVATALVSGGGEAFINKADKIVSDLMSVVHAKISEEVGFVAMDDKVFSVHFAGRYQAMLEVLIEVIEYNGFLDMLEYLKQIMPSMPGMTTKKK